MLDYGCGYAAGQAGVVNSESEVTRKLFSYAVFEYNGGSAQYFLRAWGASYRLEQFLTDQLAGIRRGDCQDVSGLLAIILNGIGVSNYVYAAGPDPYTGITTNAVCPIGQNPNVASSYQSQNWNFHQVTRVQHQAYDACIAFWTDLSWASFRSNATNWPFDGYWQTPNPAYPISPDRYLGLVHSRYQQPPSIVPYEKQFSSVIGWVY